MGHTYNTIFDFPGYREMFKKYTSSNVMLRIIQVSKDYWKMAIIASSKIQELHIKVATENVYSFLRIIA